MPRRTDYHWAETVAKLRKRPRLWMMTHQNVPAKAARRVRLRQHPALILTDGTIEAELVDRYVDDLGMERANLWLRFVPRPQNRKPDEDQNQPGG